MRDHILAEIRRLAKLGQGQPPGQQAFERDTGIAAHHWRGKFWARWGDALVEAGYQANEWQPGLDSDQVLKAIAGACRRLGKMPTVSELDICRHSDSAIPASNTIKRHFGNRAGLLDALTRLSLDDAEFSDLAAILPPAVARPTPEQPVARAKEGFVYLLKSGDFYKIGRGDDVERRVKKISVAMPDKLVLVHAIRTDDASGIEAYWHRRFDDRRMNGEWFKLVSSDVMAFKKRKFQ